MNGAIIGSLATSVLLFLSALLVPIVTKKANKATDAADSANKAAETAAAFTKTAETLVAGVNLQLAKTESQLVDTAKRCDQCLNELERMKERAMKRDLSLDAVHAALLEIVPLLHADGPATEMLRAAIRTVARARYDHDDYPDNE